MSKNYPVIEDDVSMVNEVMTIYGSINSYSIVATILGGQAVFKDRPKNSFDLIQVARDGLPKSAFLSLSSVLKLSFEKLAELIHTSARTLQRKKNTDLLSTHSSSQLILISEVLASALEAFDQNIDHAQKWLNTPLPVFGMKPAIDLLDTPMGKDLVTDQLGRLMHGVY